MAQQPSQAIQKLLQKLKNTSEEVSQSLLSEGYQRPWEDPPGWEGDIFNLEGITAAYDRQEANENYQDALKSQRPMGEAMAARIDMDYLAAHERAFRLMQMSPVRATVHAASRRRGHGHAAGVHTGVILQHLTDLIAGGQGGYGAS
jgi:hypothetical protein